MSRNIYCVLIFFLLLGYLRVYEFLDKIDGGYEILGAFGSTCPAFLTRLLLRWIELVSVSRTCLPLIWPLLDFHICHRPHQRKGRTIDVFKTQLVLPTTKCCRSWGCWLDSFPSFFTLSVVLPFHHSSSQICIPSFLFSGISRLEKVIQVDESIFIFKRDRLWYSGREKGCCIQLKKSTLEHNV